MNNHIDCISRNGSSDSYKPFNRLFCNRLRITSDGDMGLGTASPKKISRLNQQSNCWFILMVLFKMIQLELCITVQELDYLLIGR